MRIHGMISGSRVNGPGLRSVVWTQGCSLNCPGCQNPLSHPFDAGTEYECNVLADEIINSAAPGTEGLTISGGEPMQQAVSLGFLIYHVKARRPDWSIGLFSGYTRSELGRGEYQPTLEPHFGVSDFNRQLWLGIRRKLDFAILGRFDRTKLIDRAADTCIDYPPEWRIVSSSNQTVELFTNRYTLSDFPSVSMEVSIEADGLTQITGYNL
jgi:anaerobic ribonucleoside-triphosphate reductase activating protein